MLAARPPPGKELSTYPTLNVSSALPLSLSLSLTPVTVSETYGVGVPSPRYIGNILSITNVVILVSKVYIYDKNLRGSC